MTGILRLVSFVGLGLTVAPAFLVFTGALTWRAHAVWMFVGTVLWFATAPFWMRGEPEKAGAAGQGAARPNTTP
jgi:hypothetical protein